ncbi:MAG: hypothetical protein IPG79_07160 [Saprospiraceae bacterium]|nr:hypothetical protein [Saprospiraceae bacterium]
MDTLYYQRLDKNDDYVGVLYVDFVEKENKYFFEMDIVIKKKAGIFFSLKIMFTDIRVTIMMKKLNHILSKVNVI